MSRLSDIIRSITRSVAGKSANTADNDRRRERRRRRRRYNSPDTATKRSRGESDRGQTDTAKAQNDDAVERLITVNEDVRGAVEGNARSKPYDPVFLRDISANAVVQAYVDTLAQDVAASNWSIKPRDEDADIEDDALAKVERRIKELPPGTETFRDLLESTARVTLELGDAALIKHYFEDDPGRVAELVPVDSASLFKLVDRHGIIDGYVQVSKRGGTKQEEFDVDDIVWVEWSSRPDRFYGQGPLEKAQNEVELLEELAEKERLDLMQGGPPGVVAPEALDDYGGLPDDEDWETFVEGMRLDEGERHRVGYSKTPIDFTAINHNYQELQILSRSKYWVTVLGSVFKVNPSYAGFDFENVNRATDESQQAAYRQRGFRVLLRQIEESLNRGLVWDEISRDIKFEFEQEQTVDERASRASLIESQASAGKEMADAGRDVSYRDGKLVVDDGGIEEGSDDGGGLFASVDDTVGKDVPESVVDQIGEDRFVPPDGMASNAQEALDLIDEHGRDEASGGTEEAIGRARQIVDHADNGDPLVGTNADGVPYVVEIANFFARHRAQGNHEYDADQYDAKYQDPGWLADMLWGGDAGEEWASTLADDIDDAESSGSVGASPLLRASWRVSKDVTDLVPADFEFRNPNEAFRAAEILGLSGVHRHEDDNGPYYMPGGDHDRLDALLAADGGGSGNGKGVAKTPDGVPEDAQGPVDSDDVPDDATVHEGPQGGTYYVPAGGDGGLADRADSEQARETLEAVEEALQSEDMDILARMEAEDALVENTSLRTVNTEAFESQDDRDAFFAAFANLDGDGHTDEIMRVQAGISDETLSRTDDAPAGVYNHNRSTIELSPDTFDGDHFEDMNDKFGGDITAIAESSREHLVRHEVGHAAHESAAGFDQISDQYEQGWGDAVGGQVDDVEELRQTIGEELSAYAAQSPNEFVAEAFAVQYAGEDLATGLQNLYDELGGPDV